MKSRILLWAAVLLLSASCHRKSSQTWEDVKTAGRYMQRGVDSMWGKDYESRMLASDAEFIGPYDEFIPLNDSDLKALAMLGDAALPQPRGIPGSNGIPALDQFYSPSDQLGFQLVHFGTDEHILREKADLQMIHQIASYLRAHPNDLLLIEGHTDERASASYNMALGMRRANHIRQLLVKNGVNLNRIYTVSRGKEQPYVLGHTPEDWKQNRRGEFKIYEK
ncbi:MAG: pal [Parachlamydiales bacterium]|nr:pal [Parachlamydiales bacterium]